jgi:hypothetical protein
MTQCELNVIRFGQDRSNAWDGRRTAEGSDEKMCHVASKSTSNQLNVNQALQQTQELSDSDILVEKMSDQKI